MAKSLLFYNYNWLLGEKNVLLFIDSFDHYDAAHVNLKYSYTNTAAATGVIGPVSGGRNGINSFYMPDYSQCVLNLSNYQTSLIVGVAQKSAILGQNIFTIGNDNGWGITLQTNNVGGIQLSLGYNGNYSSPSFSGGVVAYSSNNNIITTNTWHYFEMLTTITGIEGQLHGNVTVNVDGATVLNATGIQVLYSAGQNTSQNSGYYFNKFTFGPNGLGQGQQYWDDFYMANTSGSYNNTFLGDVNIVAVVPSNDGSHVGFTQYGGSVGNFYTSVNEIPPDDDSSYVYSNGVGDIASFGISAPGGSLINIPGVQIVAELRKEKSGFRAFELGFGNGSVNSFSSNPTALSTNYTFQTMQMDYNPITSTSFVSSDFNSAQISVKVQ